MKTTPCETKLLQVHVYIIVIGYYENKKWERLSSPYLGQVCEIGQLTHTSLIKLGCTIYMHT